MKYILTQALNLCWLYLLSDATAQQDAEDGLGKRWNWASTVEFAAKRVRSPTDVEELRGIVNDEFSGNIRVVGTAHSWSDIADTDGTHISMENFKEIKVDKKLR